MHGVASANCMDHTADSVPTCSGHGSFSNSRALNDLVGNITHSSILVPYHGWRISHRTHHLNHGHVENDESWHPVAKHLYEKMVSLTASKRYGSQSARKVCDTREMRSLASLLASLCGGSICRPNSFRGYSSASVAMPMMRAQISIGNMAKARESSSVLIIENQGDERQL